MKKTLSKDTTRLWRRWIFNYIIEDLRNFLCIYCLACKQSIESKTAKNCGYNSGVGECSPGYLFPRKQKVNRNFFFFFLFSLSLVRFKPLKLSAWLQVEPFWHFNSPNEQDVSLPSLRRGFRVTPRLFCTCALIQSENIDLDIND